MRMLKTALAIGAICAAAAFPAQAQQADIEGTWMDSYGTTFEFSLCGEAGNALCGVLTDIQGESRTPENLAYVNEQVVTAQRTASNQWEGTVIYGGNEAAATVTQVAPDIIEITGCRLLVLCETLTFNRV